VCLVCSSTVVRNYDDDDDDDDDTSPRLPLLKNLLTNSIYQIF